MKRLIFWLLGLGLVAIITLGAFVFYSSYHLKHKLENAGNELLEEYAQILQGDEIKLTYSPLSCSGIIYIKCQIPQIQAQILDFDLTLSNLSSQLQSLDTQSLKLAIQAKLSLQDRSDELQAYANLLSPITLNATSTLQKTTQNRYTHHIQGTLDSNNFTQSFQAQWEGITENLKNENFWVYLSSKKMLNDKIQYQNLTLHTQSKDFSNALFKAVQSQNAYKGLNKQGFDTLVSFMMGILLQSLQNSPHYTQIQPLITQIQSFIIGQTEQINISIQKSNSQDFFITPSTWDQITLDDFFNHYTIQTN